MGQETEWAKLVSIEDVIGTGDGDDLRGDEHANSLSGEGGGEVIHGRGGPDRIWGDDGGDYVNSAADRLYGGAGWCCTSAPSRR